MDTLLNAYKEFPRQKWDYYEEFRVGKRSDNPFVNFPNTADAHQQFISNYFTLSGKAEVLQQFGTYDRLSDDRAFHTNSVFFLGLLIREHTRLKTRIFNEKLTKKGYPVFPFLWFLSILFHDFGMQMEEHLGEIPKLKTIEGLVEHYGISHSLFDALPDRGDPELFRMIAPYYAYRVECGKIDHGILGGFYLYDRLVKIRRAKVKLKNSELSWHHTLEKKYALAATMVACHNIWTIPCDDPNLEKYQAHSLGYLIQPRFKEISILNFPLLFLFGLADTLDPVKLYMRENKSPEEILSGIGISFEKNAVTFYKIKGSSLDFSLLIRKAASLKGWLGINSEAKNEAVRIQFC